MIALCRAPVVLLWVALFGLSVVMAEEEGGQEQYSWFQGSWVLEAVYGHDGKIYVPDEGAQPADTGKWQIRPQGSQGRQAAVMRLIVDGDTIRQSGWGDSDGEQSFRITPIDKNSFTLGMESNTDDLIVVRKVGYGICLQFFRGLDPNEQAFQTMCLGLE